MAAVPICETCNRLAIMEKEGSLQLTLLPTCCGVDVLQGFPQDPWADTITRYDYVNGKCTMVKEPWNQETLQKYIKTAKELNRRGLVQAITTEKQTKTAALLAEAGFICVHEFLNPNHDKDYGGEQLWLKVWLLPLTAAAVAPIKPQGLQPDQPVVAKPPRKARSKVATATVV